MKIRKARKKDIKYMAELVIDEFAKSPYNDKWTKREALNSIRTDMKKGEGYVAEKKGDIIGFILLRKEKIDKMYIFIENLVVREDYQRRGVGCDLVETVENKYLKAVITLSVNKKSQAYKFYKKLGYVENKTNVNMSKNPR